MTPAEELRAAAEKLRARATAATPGPWTATPRYRKGTTTIAQYDIDKPPPPGSNIRQHKVCSATRTDDLYSALIHPGVGLAIAEWLDSTARTVEAVTGKHSDAAPADVHWIAPALTVARQILGTAL